MSAGEAGVVGEVRVAGEAGVAGEVRVSGLAITPVKATRLQAVDSVRIDRDGVRANRRFFLIDPDDRMVNSTRLGLLNTLVSEYDEDSRRLAISFPDGRVIAGEAIAGEAVLTSFYSRETPARLVPGEWSEAISGYLGEPLRLVEAGEEGGVDRGREGSVTLISRASLARLAEQAGRDGVDSRRFRMLIEVDGVPAHAEDGWIGQALRVGEAVLRPNGHVGRCVITSRHPESGEVDLHTLKILGSYRRDEETTEPVAFGIYGEVVEPGTVRVGDPVTVAPAAAPPAAC